MSFYLIYSFSIHSSGISRKLGKVTHSDVDIEDCVSKDSFDKSPLGSEASLPSVCDVRVVRVAGAFLGFDKYPRVVGNG